MAKARKKVQAQRKPARRKASARRAAKTKTRAKARPSHKFTVSHHREEDFDQGLRTYAKYRDLGIAPATGGMVQAHVIRFIPPFRPEEVSTPHYHDVDFQMVYVLKGWIKSEFEGQGAHEGADQKRAAEAELHGEPPSRRGVRRRAAPLRQIP